MCGRYALNLNSETIVDEFRARNVDLEAKQMPSFKERYNVGPTQEVPVYHDSHLQLMKWGMIPFWTKDLSKATPWKTFNARAESVFKSRLWKPSLNHKRCVVPISGYYEWQGKKGEKTPYFIRRKDKKVMFLAGLFDMVELKADQKTKEDPDGETQQLWSFTIITGPAPKDLEWLHERMPVVLEPNSKQWESWLDPKRDSWSEDEIMDELKPVWRESEYEWYPVPKEVGNVQNNEKRLMEKAIPKSAPAGAAAKKPRGGIDSFFKQKKEQEDETKPKPEPEHAHQPKRHLKREEESSNDLEAPQKKVKKE